MFEAKDSPEMNTQLPADLDQFVQAKVRSGRFNSAEEAIAAGVRLLRQQEEAEEARVERGHPPWPGGYACRPGTTGRRHIR